MGTAGKQRDGFTRLYEGHPSAHGQRDGGASR
jgi:hypothetical protein